MCHGTNFLGGSAWPKLNGKHLAIFTLQGGVKEYSIKKTPYSPFDTLRAVSVSNRLAAVSLPNGSSL